MIVNINDDRMIMEILSGRYLGSPEGHGVYMNYPLTWFLTLLYRAFPSRDWYGTFLLGIMLLCLVLCCIAMAGTVHGTKQKLLICMLTGSAYLTLAGSRVLSVTYSEVAAICGATTCLWYGTTDGKKYRSIVTAILAALTWCIRSQLFYMILPAAGIIWLFKQEENLKSRRFKEAFLHVGIIMGTVLLCMIWNGIAYGSSAWKNYTNYNAQRTRIYDFADSYYLPDYETYRDYYDELNLNNEQRRMLIQSNFLLLEDDVGPEIFQKMIDIRPNYASGENSNSTNVNDRIKTGISHMLDHIRTNAYGWLFTFSAVGYIILCLFLFVKRKKRFGFYSLLMGGMQGALWLYMEILGRMPERVIYSLSLLLLVTLVIMIYNGRDSFKSINIEPTAIMTICCVLILLFSEIGISQCMKTYREVKIQETENKKLDMIREYCREHEDDFYMITVASLTGFGYNISFDQIDNSELNYLSTGDWISFSPVVQAKETQMGIKSVSESLIHGEIYLIAQDDVSLKFIEDYLKTRSKTVINARLIENISEDYGVYQFLTNE